MGEDLSQLIETATISEHNFYTAIAHVLVLAFGVVTIVVAIVTLKKSLPHPTHSFDDLLLQISFENIC